MNILRYFLLIICLWLSPSPVAWAQHSPEEAPTVIDEQDVPLEEAEMMEEGVDDDDIDGGVYPYMSQQEVLGLNKEKTTNRNIDQSQWTKAIEGMDFSNDRPKPVSAKQKEPSRSYNGPDWNPDVDAWKNFFKIFSLILLLGLVGWLLYAFLQVPSNTVIRAEDGTTITLDNLDAYIQETDLQRFLRMALEAGDYNQAVRIHYLEIIKTLSQKGAIHWSREKTNRDYLREMRQHPQHGDFRENTRLYESVWYGNGELDKSIYERIAARMQRFLSRL